MRGKLSEINLRSLFKLLASERQTGILYVETTAYFLDHSGLEIENYALVPRFKPNSWLIFFVNGRITYATSTNNIDLTRIKDYLSFYKLEKFVLLEDNISVNITSTPEYNYLVYLLQQKTISLPQAQKIIHKTIKETLFELLNLATGYFSFQVDYALPPAIADLEIQNLIPSIYSDLKKWKQFFPHISSPHQSPVFRDPSAIKQATSVKTYTTLSNWIDKRISLMRLARQINCQVIDLATALYPYIKKGWIGIDNIDSFPPQNTLNIDLELKPHIVYVDNDVAIAKKVEYILKRRGYESTIFSDSISALNNILQTRPNLVLCKMNLPQLSGDELCSTIKNSRTSRRTKIVLLGEAENFFERVRARLVSSDDYLSLPFTQSELLVLVEQHLDLNYHQNLALVQQRSPEKSNS